MTNTILTDLRAALRDVADPAVRDGTTRYFKEPVQSYGVRNGEVNRLARDSFREIKALEKADIYALCEDLLQSGLIEEAMVAFEWARRLEKRYDKNDFLVYERWLHEYVTNWATCDTLCNHPVGTLVMMYNEFVTDLKSWAFSRNRWVRRGAAVSLVIPARRGHLLPDVLTIADTLLEDPDDLVRKGYGWILKEASRLHPQEVFDFITKHKAVMPRVALRYAIEKLPADLRKAAMRTE